MLCASMFAVNDPICSSMMNRLDHLFALHKVAIENLLFEVYTVYAFVEKALDECQDSELENLFKKEVLKHTVIINFE